MRSQIKITQMSKNFFIILILVGGSVIIGGGFLLAGKSSQPKGLSNVSAPLISTRNDINFNFLGEKGENVSLNDEEIRLAASNFDDNQAHFYNVKMPSGKIIYFFVVKDSNGIYRAAANACAVCFKTYKGFRQEGNEIVCNNCGNRYPIEKIATEKGGCNPGPISPNLEVENGEIIIKKVDIEQVLNLF